MGLKSDERVRSQCGKQVARIKLVCQTVRMTVSLQLGKARGLMQCAADAAQASEGQVKKLREELRLAEERVVALNAEVVIVRRRGLLSSGRWRRSTRKRRKS